MPRKTNLALSGDLTVSNDTTINGAATFNSTSTFNDNVTLASGKTVDGRDISLDGSVQDAHIADSDNPHSTTMDHISGGGHGSEGDIVVRSSSGGTRLSAGAADTFLHSNGSNIVTWKSGLHLTSYDAVVPSTTYATIGAALNAGKKNILLAPSATNPMQTETQELLIPSGVSIKGKDKTVTVNLGSYQLKNATPVISNTGTVSVSTGSKNVTGTSTTFQTDAVDSSFFIKLDSKWYEVASVTDNTTLTLKYDYSGKTNLSNVSCLIVNLFTNIHIENVNFTQTTQTDKGLELKYCDKIVLQNVTCTNMTDALIVEQCNKPSLVKVTAEKCINGIKLINCTQPSTEYVECRDGEKGLLVDTCYKSNIQWSRFNGLTEYGLYVKDSTKNRLNLVHATDTGDVGVKLENVVALDFNTAIITACTTGIIVTGSSSKSVFLHGMSSISYGTKAVDIQAGTTHCIGGVYTTDITQEHLICTATNCNLSSYSLSSSVSNNTYPFVKLVGDSNTFLYSNWSCSGAICGPVVEVTGKYCSVLSNEGLTSGSNGYGSTKIIHFKTGSDYGKAHKNLLKVENASYYYTGTCFYVESSYCDISHNTGVKIDQGLYLTGSINGITYTNNQFDATTPITNSATDAVELSHDSTDATLKAKGLKLNVHADGDLEVQTTANSLKLESTDTSSSGKVHLKSFGTSATEAVRIESLGGAKFDAQQDVDISSANSTILVQSTADTSADAIKLNSVAGGLVLNSAKTVDIDAGVNLDIDVVGLTNITTGTTFDVLSSGNITLNSNGGDSSYQGTGHVHLLSTTDTATDAIKISAQKGGIQILSQTSAGTLDSNEQGKGIVITAGLGTDSTTTSTTGTGGDCTISAGQGGQTNYATGGVLGGVGGKTTIKGGKGGASSTTNNDGGTGGNIDILGGEGGVAGSSPSKEGKGGSVNITGGAEGTAGGVSGLGGGDVIITGGVSATSSVSGMVKLVTDKNASDAIWLNATSSSSEIHLESAGTGTQSLWLESAGDIKISTKTSGNVDISDNVVIHGNLTVDGTYLVEADIADPLLLINSNNATDVDLGLIAKYTNSGAKYAGIYRDTSVNEKFHIFTGLTSDPTESGDNTVFENAENLPTAPLNGYTPARLVTAGIDITSANIGGTTFISGTRTDASLIENIFYNDHSTGTADYGMTMKMKAADQVGRFAGFASSIEGDGEAFLGITKGGLAFFNLHTDDTITTTTTGTRIWDVGTSSINPYYLRIENGLDMDGAKITSASSTTLETTNNSADLIIQTTGTSSNLNLKTTDDSALVNLTTIGDSADILIRASGDSSDVTVEASSINSVAYLKHSGGATGRTEISSGGSAVSDTAAALQLTSSGAGSLSLYSSSSTDASSIKLSSNAGGVVINSELKTALSSADTNTDAISLTTSGLGGGIDIDSNKGRVRIRSQTTQASNDSDAQDIIIGGAGTGGDASSSAGGRGTDISLTSGTGGAGATTYNSGAGGSISLVTSSGGSTAGSGDGGAGGSINLTCGNGGTSTSGDDGSGGSLLFTAGDAGASAGSGGNITLTAGTSTTKANAGKITLTTDAEVLNALHLNVTGSNAGQIHIESQGTATGSQGTSSSQLPIVIESAGDIDMITKSGGTVYVNQHLIIGGDLTVTGTTITETDLADPLFRLNAGSTTDTKDVGWVAEYDAGSGTVHRGIFSETGPKYKIRAFSGLTTAVHAAGDNTISEHADPDINGYMPVGAWYSDINFTDSSLDPSWMLKGTRSYDGLIQNVLTNSDTTSSSANGMIIKLETGDASSHLAGYTSSVTDALYSFNGVSQTDSLAFWSVGTSDITTISSGTRIFDTGPSSTNPHFLHILQGIDMDGKNIVSAGDHTHEVTAGNFTSQTTGANTVHTIKHSGQTTGKVLISSDGTTVDDDSAALQLTSAGGLTLKSTSTDNSALRVHAPSGGLDLDTAKIMHLTSTLATYPSIRMTCNTSAGGLQVEAGTGGIIQTSADNFDVTASGAVAGAIKLYADESNSATTIHLDSRGTGASAINIDSTGGIDLDCVSDATLDISAGGFKVNSVGGFNSFISDTTGNLFKTTSGTLDLTVDDNTSAGIMTLTCNGTLEATSSAGAIAITATAGGIAMQSQKDFVVGSTAGDYILTANGALQFQGGAASYFQTSTGSMTVKTDSGPITLQTTGSGASDITTLSSAGSTVAGDGVGAVVINATAGGVALKSADAIFANATQEIHVATPYNDLSAIKFNASVGGMDIDVGSGYDLKSTGGKITIENSNATTDAIKLLTSSNDGNCSLRIHARGSGSNGLTETYALILQSENGGTRFLSQKRYDILVSTQDYNLETTTGNVYVKAKATSQDIDLNSELGAIVLTSNEDMATSMKFLNSNTGTNSRMLLESRGTRNEAIDLNSVNGGVRIRANTTKAANNTDSSALIITGGIGGDAVSSTGGIGGVLTCTGGVGGASTGTDVCGAGGKATFNAGQGGSSTDVDGTGGAGGVLELHAGAGGTPLNTTNNGVGGAGGNLTLKGGQGQAGGTVGGSSGNGGTVTIQGGNSSSTGATKGSGGNVSITGGTSGNTAVAGKVTLTSTRDTADAIKLFSSGASSSTIMIHNDTSTIKTQDASAIQLLADAGGVGITSNLNSSDCIYISTAGGSSSSIQIANTAGTSTGLHASNPSVELYSQQGGVTLYADESTDTKAVHLRAENGGIWLNAEHATTGLVRIEGNGADNSAVYIHAKTSNEASRINLVSAGTGSQAINLESTGGIKAVSTGAHAIDFYANGGVGAKFVAHSDDDIQIHRGSSNGGDNTNYKWPRTRRNANTFLQLNTSQVASSGTSDLEWLYANLFDCIVHATSGDYTTIEAAVTAGEKKIGVRAGSYAISSTLTIPNDVTIQGASETDTFINLGDGAQLLIQGQSTTYSTGTVSITSGSTTVTGSSTLWSANAQDGDYIVIGPASYLVSTVDSDTSLTLASAWEGKSISSSAYNIATMTKNCSLKNLTITSTDTVAIKAKNTHNLLLDHLIVEPPSSGSNNGGIDVELSSFCTISNCIISGAESVGLTLTQSTSSTVDSCNINNSASYGINVTNCSNVKITNISSFANGSDGIIIQGGSSHASNNVANCSFYFNDNHGINCIASASNTLIQSCYCYSNASYGASVLGTYSSITQSLLEANTQIGIELGSNCLAENNVCRGNLTNQVATVSGLSTAATIKNNHIDASGSNASQDAISVSSTSAKLNICGNVIDNATNNGISLTSSTFSTVNNNVIKDSTLSGILISTGCQDSQVTGNTCVSNGTEGILVQSARVNISTNVCQGNTQNGISISSASDCNISANICENNTQEGIKIDSSDNTNVSANSCSNNTNSGILVNSSDEVCISSNTCRSNTQDGIKLTSAVDAIVSSNRCLSNNVNLSIDSSSTEAIISSNNLKTSTTTDITGVTTDGILLTANKYSTSS